MEFDNFSPNIIVIGLGYVGLPLAVELAKHFPVLGFDISEARIKELQQGYDRTREISKERLVSSSLRTTSQFNDLNQLVKELEDLPINRSASQSTDKTADKSQDKQTIYIVTVPTPVTSENLPDLTPLQKASETVAKVLKKGNIVVYESTVYPGVTEEYCGPILEKISGLKAGKDFYLGYSPERINPGDTEHTLSRITKVVAGQTREVADKLEFLYGKLNNSNIFRAKDIKTAEAAKVIENAQRDINIAFINEIAIIVGKLGLSIYDVLAAAETKWNFLKFKPGLVGGHCIGVDPYYLSYCSQMLGHEPEVILSGRHTNERMGQFVAESVHRELGQLEKLGKLDKLHKARILVLGLTFKEDIPDLRNTKVIDVIHSLQALGHEVEVHDPMASVAEAESHLGLQLMPTLEGVKPYDCVLGAVAHKQYLDFSKEKIQQLLKPQGLLADLKNMWDKSKVPAGIHYWSL
jgi:UDP-N-acetyl-D-galactosamine dehydrogenase